MIAGANPPNLFNIDQPAPISGFLWLALRSEQRLGIFPHMDLPEMLVELPLQGLHRRCRVPGHPRSANRKVFVATGALAVQPGFVVLGDLKMWLLHGLSFLQT
jgi:hypothetical protein